MAYSGARPNRPSFGQPNQLLGNGMPNPNYGGAPSSGINTGPSPGMMGLLNPGQPAMPNPIPGGQPAPMNPGLSPLPNPNSSGGGFTPLPPTMPNPPTNPNPGSGGFTPLPPTMPNPSNINKRLEGTYFPTSTPSMGPPDPMIGGGPINTGPSQIPNMGGGGGGMGQAPIGGGLAGAYGNPGPAMKRPFGQG
jgi:hypothetical protein